MNRMSESTAGETSATHFGRSMKAVRAEKKVSQVELAGLVGVTQSLVSAYEKGDRKSVV